MIDVSVYQPKPGKTVKLADYDPNHVAGMTKAESREVLDDLRDRLKDLQEMLYAHSTQSLLVVFQAMDTGGKDGVIKDVFKGVNPIGLRIAPFKAPTSVELAHDFLWRVHQQTPPLGYIGIFNRSHYEDVLVVRVNELVSKSVWSARYDHINNFEHLLADNGTRVIKFYLNISKDEQKERLQARLDNPDKHWKFSKGDLPVREQWDDYMAAYEDVLTKCNTEEAPWVIVPSNKKWFRNVVVAQTLVNTLESMKLSFPQPEEDLSDVVIPD
jgi:PPK2 family polyphosphate:nucleotide phosphotransferase